MLGIKWKLFCIVLLILLPSAGFSRDYIKITDPNFQPYPLAIPEFKIVDPDTAQLAKEGVETLRFDLAVAGVFKLLDPRSYIADPKQEGLSVATIRFSNWFSVGAEGLIKVGVFKSGTRVTLDCHLFDVPSGKELLHKKYESDQKSYRLMVHTFADAVVRHFTATASVFFTKIVFAKESSSKSKTNREKKICVMDFDGHNEFCPVRNSSINLLPAWSADGGSFYYSSYINGGPHLFSYNLKTKKNVLVSKRPGLNVGAATSPNGKQVALTLSRDDNAEIYVMETNGAKPTRLTRDWAIDSSATWSPDSMRISFVSERSGTPQIYVMNASGTEQKRLTFKGNYNQTPDWSPRGDFILFNARDERLVFDIFKIRPDTAEIVRLTQDQGNNEHPSFSPDGNQVVFSSTRSGESKLYMMNADGTNQRILSRQKGEYTTPDWGPWVERD